MEDEMENTLKIILRGDIDATTLSRWIRSHKAVAWAEGWSAGYSDGEAEADELFAPGELARNPYR